MSDDVEPAPIKSSTDKLRELFAELRAAKPTDEADARKLAILGGIAPIAAANLPDDPVELDALLLQGAGWAMRLRSDDAPMPASVAELAAAGPE